MAEWVEAQSEALVPGDRTGAEIAADITAAASNFARGVGEKFGQSGAKGDGWSAPKAVRGHAKSAMEDYLFDYWAEQSAEAAARRRFGKGMDELPPDQQTDAAYETRGPSVWRSFLKDWSNPFRMGRGTSESADKLIQPGFDEIDRELSQPTSNK
jgi:hypothetical protein